MIERTLFSEEHGMFRDSVRRFMKAQDTSELFFDDVEVPVANLLGEENAGFVYLSC